MPYKPTGRPPGRPKGVKPTAPIKRAAASAKPPKPKRERKAKSERETIEALDARVEQALATLRPPDVVPFKGGAVEFLMSLYKDPLQPLPIRLDAAKAAAKYESPALQAITMTQTDPLQDIDDPDELLRAIQAEAIALGIAAPPDAPRKGGARGKSQPVRH